MTSTLTTEDGRRLVEASDVLLADGPDKHGLMSVELWGPQPAQVAREYGRFLYAIQTESGPIKIGVADKPWERLQTLQTGNHERLTGLAAFPCIPSDERALHQRFASARIRGEWFYPVPDLVEFMLFHGGFFCDWEKP